MGEQTNMFLGRVNKGVRIRVGDTVSHLGLVYVVIDINKKNDLPVRIQREEKKLFVIFNNIRLLERGTEKLKLFES